MKLSKHKLGELIEVTRGASLSGQFYAEEGELIRLTLGNFNMAKTEHSHPLGMVVSTHFRCGKGVKRGLKNGALPFNID